MTRIAFWNLQRLGAGTDAARRRGLTTLATYWDPDLMLMCELTTRCVYPRARNLTYRRVGSRQLCYGALDDNDTDVRLTADLPPLAPAYSAAGYRGGNNFKNLVNRALGRAALMATLGNVRVFVIHAPAAAASAARAMAYVAAGIDQRYAGSGLQWIVVGDFNVKPQVLGAQPLVGLNINNLISRPYTPTHYYRPTRKFSEIDYALTNIRGLTVRSMRLTRWWGLSDHSPILLEF